MMAGTCAEYDWSFGTCIEGATPVRPISAYARAMDEVRRASERIAEEAGIGLAWARLFFLYGPHEVESRLVPSVTRALLRGEHVGCSDGRQVRDYLYVADAAEALVALLEADVEGPVNIGSGEPREVRAIISCISEHTGGGALVNWGALPRRENDPPCIVASTERLRHEAAWLPRTGLDEGIARTVAWWSHHMGIEQAHGASLDAAR